MKILFLIVFVPVISTQLCDNITGIAETEISAKCLRQVQMMCNNGPLLWQMIDASSKYPFTGLSYSSNKDYGNFDECIDVNYESLEGNVMGKYCPLSVAVLNPSIEPIPDPQNLIIAPKSLAPRDVSEVAMSLLSVCIPDECTTKEVGTYFLSSQLQNVSVSFVDSFGCTTKETNTNFEWGAIAFITFLALMLLLVLCSTGYDYVIHKCGRKPDHPLLLAFSLITNTRKLLHISRSSSFEQIQCLNGIRFISMMWIIALHGFDAMFQVPLINFKELRSYLDNPASQYIHGASFAVDTFFFLSGFLLCFGYLKAPAKAPVKTQISKVPMMIVHRYLRLTPALAVLFFASITVYKMMGSGPMFGMFANLFNTQCKEYWWSFFTYIQNYTNYNEMCLMHSWYLSADMQMFILAPLVLIPVAELVKRKKTKVAILGLLALIIVCVIVPMVIRFADHTVDNQFDTHSRLNDYLIGVLLGLILRQPKFQHFPFNKLTSLGIWGFALVTCVCCNLYYHSVDRIPDHTSTTLFYGLYRPIWCFFLAWTVYSCHLGYGGPINWFLSLPAFQIGARLSYCMYLLHYMIELYWVGVVRTPYHFNDYMMFYVWCGHFIVTLVLSFVWTLFFEAPMIIIEKYVFGGK